MGIKVIKGPDGKSQTIEVPDHDTKALADLHKEVKDMFEGNTQFHDDPRAKPVPKPVQESPSPDEDDYWYNHIYP